MDPLALALVLALLAWSGTKGWRWFKVQRARRARRTQPGLSADFPLTLDSRQVFEDACAALRCPCGGEVKPLGEGSHQGLRVARHRCRACGAPVDLFFLLPRFLN